jgi:aldoxime dehydratase
MPEQAAEGPGRECAFPSTMTNMVFALYGIQTDDEERTKHWLEGLRGLFDDPNGPGRVERSHGLHPSTGHNTILMAYWIDMGAARAWHDRPEVRQWWAGLPDDEEGVGYWRELLASTVGRFHFFGVGPHKVASHALLEAKGSDNFGYWGGYRDRMAQHDTDTFTSDLDELPPRLAHPSYGRRLSVSVPNNLCFVREGADPSHITMAKERELWEHQLKPASQKWVQYLAENPKTSGCVTIIDTVEQDLDTGEDLDKNSQFAYFLSLRHLERAARTQPSHLALYNTFMGTFMELAAEGIDMGLFIWAEAHILQNGELNAEYVNCHPSTGLLSHFATVEAAAPAPA